MKTFVKDPYSVLDYIFDWTEWLGETDTIIEHVVYTSIILPGELDILDTLHLGGKITAWISED